MFIPREYEVVLHKNSAKFRENKRNTVALAWGDGILLNWTQQNNNQWKPLLNFQYEKRNQNAHRFGIHTIIVYERKTEGMKRTQCVRTVNSYAKMCMFSHSLWFAAYCCCCCRCFFFCVTLPLIDHIFTCSVILPHFAVLIQCVLFQVVLHGSTSSATFIICSEYATKNALGNKIKQNEEKMQYSKWRRRQQWTDKTVGLLMIWRLYIYIRSIW